jgi:hypothetical protein
VGAELEQSPVLLRNQGNGRFQDMSPRGGDYFAEKHSGRGLAIGDLDNDGRLDAVISHLNRPVTVLRNIADTGNHHWLGLSLHGRDHRDLVGTTITVESGDKRWTRFVVGGGSYLSAHDQRLVIGLGLADRIDKLTIRWSNGGTQTSEGSQLRLDVYNDKHEAAPTGSDTNSHGSDDM